jgi:predicted aspartyl protease
MKRKATFGLLTAAAVRCFGASVVTSIPGPETVPVHRLKLDPFLASPTRLVGMIVKARINGGPPLRLLLDSGANLITLDPKAAAKSSCAGGTDLDLVGAGAPAAAGAKQVRVATVQIGPVLFRELPVLVSGRAVGEGIDGALPLSVFSGFLIRLNVPRRTLDLLPYTAASSEGGDNLQAISNNDLLFVRGSVNGRREGYFLLDTGASYVALSKTVARELNFSEALAERVPLQAGTADLNAPLVRGGVRLRFGARELEASSVVTVDLSVSSRYHNLDIAGLLGFPALSGSVLVVNYRDGLVRIEPTKSH